jgi:hypothetical protein
MSFVADGAYEQVGTFNGNPLAMAGPRHAYPCSRPMRTSTNRLRERMVRAASGSSRPRPDRARQPSAPRAASRLDPDPELPGLWRSMTGSATPLADAARRGVFPRRGARPNSGCCRQHTDDDVDVFLRTSNGSPELIRGERASP